MNMYSGPATTFSIGGLHLRLIDPPEIIATSMAKAFSLSRTAGERRDIAMEAVLRDDDAFRESMPGAVRETYDRLPAGDDPFVLTAPDGTFTVIVKREGTGAYARVPPDGDRVDLVCQHLTREKGPLHFQPVFIPVLKHLLLQRGKLLVHAGCVAATDGRGLLFAGLSGSGKTTTCIALTLAGFRFLSDDLVVLSVQDGKATVEGIREHMNLTRKTLEFFPELAPSRKDLGRAEYRGKVPVDPDVLFGTDRIAEQATLDSLAVIRIGREGPALVPVSPPSVLNVLLQNHVFETGAPISRKSMDILWDILGVVRTFELRTGPDPAAMGSHVFDLFHDDAPSRRSRSARRKVSARRNRPDPAEAASLIGSVLGHTLDGLPGPAEVPGSAVRLFTYHRLETHLARWMKDRGHHSAADGFAPDRVLSSASALALQRDAVTAQVHGALRDAGISSLLLRGPAIAKRFFPDETLRTARDIDLVIPRERLLQAAGILEAQGFRPDRDLAYWEQRGEWPFTNGSTIVELHWEAYPGPFHRTPGLGFDHVLAAADRVTVGNEKIDCLSADHLLLSSILHAAYDHQLDRLIRLVDVRQVMKLSANAIDGEWVAQKVRETGTAVAVRSALECLAAVMPDPLPPALRDLPVPAFRKRLADLALPDDRIISGRLHAARLRRWVFLRALRPVR